MQRDSFVLRLISKFFTHTSAKNSELSRWQPGCLETVNTDKTRGFPNPPRDGSGVSASDRFISNNINQPQKPINKSASIDELFNKRNSPGNVYAMNNCLNLLYSLRGQFVLHSLSDAGGLSKTLVTPVLFFEHTKRNTNMPFVGKWPRKRQFSLQLYYVCVISSRQTRLIGAHRRAPTRI